jgi:hypothetical protein
MSRLTSKVTAAGKKGGTGAYMGPEGGLPTPTGIVVDGVVYPLAGQPPVAVSHGWGNLAFLYLPRSG